MCEKCVQDGMMTQEDLDKSNLLGDDQRMVIISMVKNHMDNIIRLTQKLIPGDPIAALIGGCVANLIALNGMEDENEKIAAFKKFKDFLLAYNEEFHGYKRKITHQEPKNVQ